MENVGKDNGENSSHTVGLKTNISTSNGFRETVGADALNINWGNGLIIDTIQRDFDC